MYLGQVIELMIEMVKRDNSLMLIDCGFGASVMGKVLFGPHNAVSYQTFPDDSENTPQCEVCDHDEGVDEATYKVYDPDNNRWMYLCYTHTEQFAHSDFESSE